MEVNDIIWMVAYLNLILVIHFLYYVMVASLKDKPPGVQTIYDQALQDTFLIANIYASSICYGIIVSRYESIYRENVHYRIIFIHYIKLENISLRVAIMSGAV